MYPPGYYPSYNQQVYYHQAPVYGQAPPPYSAQPPPGYPSTPPLEWQATGTSPAPPPPAFHNITAKKTNIVV